VNYATVYDLINGAIFLPWGGSRRLRQSLVDALELRPGARVLELGCGTGQVTECLIDAGADVVAVDQLPMMIDRARRRVPGAAFVEGDAMTVDVGANFDRVVLSFVLHNFDAAGRVLLLRRASVALGLDGRIGVLDWALPRGRLRTALWERFVRAIEPSGEAQAVMHGAIDMDLRTAKLDLVSRRRVLGGRAQIIVVQPHDDLAYGPRC
jgi:ubiquinone/menaquinone biosynthesis C-methylase UbiE